MGLLAVIGVLLAGITVFVPKYQLRVGADIPGAPGTAAAVGTSAATGEDESPTKPDRKPNADASAVPLPQPAPTTAPAAIVGSIAIVIDDVGNNLEELAPFLQLPGPITFAVLPHLANSEAAATAVRRSGHQVILHAPMQTVDDVWPGPGTLTVEHELLALWEQLASSFDSIAGAPGANNHMGSRLTVDPIAMDAVMAYLSATGRFFLDSRTAVSTVAEQFAQTHRVPFVRRDIFLDNVRDYETIAEAFAQGIALAVDRGYATVIGHAASAELAAFLAQRLPLLAVEGVELVSVAALAGSEALVTVASR